MSFDPAVLDDPYDPDSFEERVAVRALTEGGEPSSPVAEVPLGEWTDADAMPLDEILAQMRLRESSGDTENAHFDADVLLCGALWQLGQHELVESYRRVGKWFA